MVCTKPGTNWPSGSFNVSLTATDKGNVCQATRSTATLVTITNVPIINVTGPPDVAVCTSSRAVNLTYNVSGSPSGVTGVQATANVTGISCTAALNQGLCITGQPMLACSVRCIPLCV